MLALRRHYKYSGFTLNRTKLFPVEYQVYAGVTVNKRDLGWPVHVTSMVNTAHGMFFLLKAKSKLDITYTYGQFLNLSEQPGHPG